MSCFSFFSKTMIMFHFTKKYLFKLRKSSLNNFFTVVFKVHFVLRTIVWKENYGYLKTHKSIHYNKIVLIKNQKWHNFSNVS